MGRRHKKIIIEKKIHKKCTTLLVIRELQSTNIHFRKTILNEKSNTKMLMKIWYDWSSLCW